MVVEKFHLQVESMHFGYLYPMLYEKKNQSRGLENVIVSVVNGKLSLNISDFFLFR